VASSWALIDIAAKQAHKIGYLTNRQIFMAFDHLAFYVKSKRILGYGETPKLTNPPSFLLMVT
jgi:hypothetical protein